MKSGKTEESHLPVLEKKYYSSFTLGYFDGDGSIYLQPTGKNKKCYGGFVDIISNNFIINELINKIKKETGVTFNQKYDPSGKYSHMYICNYKDIKIFYDYI